MTTLYLVIVLFIILALFLCKGTNDKKEKAYLMICFMVMLILHTFFNPEYSDNYFYKIGYGEYQSMSLFEVLQENSPSLKAETGYRVLCKILTYISKDWVFGMFVISLIMLSGYYLVVRRYSSIAWLSVLIIMVGPFTQSLFVLRQHLAMGIILFSYPYILQKKIVPYLIICFLAISCHQTAAVFLPTYFIYNVRKPSYIITLFLVLFFLFYYYFSFFLSTAASIVMETVSYGDYYFEYDMESGTNNKMALLLVTLLIMRIILMKKDFFKEGINRLMSIIMIIGTIFSVVGIGLMATSRLNMYYSEAAFIYIPNTFQYVKKKEIRTMCGIGYFLFFFYFMIKNASNGDMSEFWFFSK